MKSIVGDTARHRQPTGIRGGRRLIAGHKIAGVTWSWSRLRRGDRRADRPRIGCHPCNGHQDGRRGRPLHRRDRLLLLRRGKVEAIRQLAAREGYALEHCYAYSDSITDLPMLEAVGHPTVVNPDRALRKEASARDWPMLTFSKPVSLRDRIPAPSGAAVATTAAVGVSALAAGALTYSLLRRFAF